MHELIRIHPRDDTFYVSQNRTVLATNRDGFIQDGAEHGLFVHETRMLSLYRYLISGKQPKHVGLSNVEPHSWLGYYIVPPPDALTTPDSAGQGSPDAAQNTIELRLSRFVGDGVHEDADITNFTQQNVTFELAIEIDADFADIEETNGNRKQHGTIVRNWAQTEGNRWELVLKYEASHVFDHGSEKGTAAIARSIRIQIESADSPPSYDNGTIRFQVHLTPQATWHCCFHLIPTIDGRLLEQLYGCRSFGKIQNERDRHRKLFLSGTTSFQSPGADTLTSTVITSLETARKDLIALRLYDLDQAPDAWTMAAGLPVYISLFGRDTLTAAWQAAIISPEMMKGTLMELSRWQGKIINDWRDEQPGRMIHEVHTGPLEVLNFNPRARSYSSVTTSGFFPVVLAELWHWTGNKELILPLLEPALKSLRWADEYGDLDGDGFYEYQTRSSQGVRNQAWKDSGDAIVYEDGTQVQPPIATCEEQAFLYVAKLMMAEVLWWVDRKEESKICFRQAAELKKRFNDAFWIEDENFYAMGLDSKKQQIRSIGSNAGHCLAAAIVDEDLAGRTAGRLIAPDLFSGWGIRTLSSNHPAYNPYSYHRGSVWPVEQGTFALGFMRYGLPKHLHLLAKAQFEAASLFNYCRLPEVFGGHQRDEDHPFPGLYPKANWPQAWSASAMFSFIQAMLGLYPYAPLHLLIVDPHLPEWLPEITIENLRIGDAKTRIRFYRKSDSKSDYEVEEIQGKLHVVRQPSPWSLTATVPERAKDLLTSLLPGK